ncbi:hypothetical protein ACJX0J_021139 [Zea mays]
MAQMRNFMMQRDTLPRFFKNKLFRSETEIANLHLQGDCQMCPHLAVHLAAYEILLMLIKHNIEASLEYYGSNVSNFTNILRNPQIILHRKYKICFMFFYYLYSVDLYYYAYCWNLNYF